MQVTLDAGSIVTRSQLVHGVVAQAIGGGGGNAGDATATGVLVTVTTGGTGGSGGDGGTVAVALDDRTAPASIGTFGANALHGGSLAVAVRF